MSRYKGTNVPKQPTVPPMPKKRRYIDESILVEKVYNGEGLPTISRSVLVNCVLPTIPTADVVEVVRCKDCRYWRDNDHTCKYSFTSPMCANEFCSRGER